MTMGAGLLTELKRRKVFRVAVVYAATAFVVLQAAELMLPRLGVPDWVSGLIVVLVILGFPIALVLGWALELTPEGIKVAPRRAEAVTAEPPPSLLGKRTVLVAGALVMLGVGLGAGWFLRPVGLQDVSPVADPVADREPVVTPEPAPAPEALGIGVLPFTNLSPDPDNAFFAGGVHEEILTHLSRMGELRVISRTSMERIAEDRLEVSEIGRRLGVSHVMEGSVRRAGNQVRVTVQLIEADTDRHIWAENYDRTLDDIFAIQSQIALAIAEQLQVTLSPAQLADIEARPTDNREAHDLYLRAREKNRAWRGVQGFLDIIDLLEPAIALDPDFLQARVLLSRAYGQLHRNDLDRYQRWDSKARSQLAEIVGRWPHHPQALLAQAHYDRLISRDYERALAGFQALANELPNDVEVLAEVATTLKWLARREAFLDAARQVAMLDPEAQGSHLELTIALRMNGLGEEAIRVAEQALLRFPGDLYLQLLLAESKLDFRQDLSAILELPPLLAASTESHPDFEQLVAAAHFTTGDTDGAIAWLESLRERRTGVALASVDANLADFLRLTGRDEEAVAPARRAFEEARAWVEARRDPDDDLWFAWPAAVAALAGEHELAATWLARAEQEARQDLISQFVLDRNAAIVYRWLGDVEAAWARIAPHAGDPLFYPKGHLLALKQYYDAMYGESEAYREFMRKLEAEAGGR